jgi:hypothetical protein
MAARNSRLTRSARSGLGALGSEKKAGVVKDTSELGFSKEIENAVFVLRRGE